MARGWLAKKAAHVILQRKSGRSLPIPANSAAKAKAYVSFNNHARGQAVANALMLKAGRLA